MLVWHICVSRNICIPPFTIFGHTFFINSSKDKRSLQSELDVLNKDVQRISRNQQKIVSQIQTHLNDLSKKLCNQVNRLDAIEQDFVHRESTKQESESIRSSIEDQSSSSPIEIVIEDQNQLNTPVYLKNFRDGIMTECKKADAQFLIKNMSDTKASFSFCGDVSAALATKDATFSDVCALMGWNNDVQSIVEISAGEVSKLSDGKWKVVKMALLKCN